MGRTLSVSRVRVAPEREKEYLATLQRLAVLLLRRDQHLWVFRNSRHPGEFIEFSESASPMAHRSRASRTQDELKLEMRLQALADYAPDAWELWDEVTADAPLPEE